MPTAPPRACEFPGCKNYAVGRTWRCADHAKKDVEESRQTDALRYKNTPHRKLYDQAAWHKNLQPFILARDPLCRLQITDLCKQHDGDGSTVVDHIVDHKGNPALFFDPANCQGVCKPCHDRKTKTASGRAPKVHGPFCLLRKNAGVCTCEVNDASVPL